MGFDVFDTSKTVKNTIFRGPKCVSQKVPKNTKKWSLHETPYQTLWTDQKLLGGEIKKNPENSTFLGFLEKHEN